MTKVVKIGDRVIGGGNPILIQSMTNTKTEDVAATVAQIQALTAAGCDIIRCAVPTMEAAEALTEIKKQVSIPVVQIFILITAWRLPRSSTVRIRSASIREISEVQSVCAQWWMPQKSAGFRSVSASTVDLWKKILWKNITV